MLHHENRTEEELALSSLIPQPSQMAAFASMF